MALGPISELSGKAVVIPGNDIDTDRIIPARFLKCITFDDLAAGLFHDERFGADGASKGHPLDAPAAQGANIIITDENFGCGSSREHAPQAIRRAGFGGVIAGSFAEIFYGNATTIGLLCASVGEPERAELAELVRLNPATTVTIDVKGSEVRAELAGETRTFQAEFRESARGALLNGTYDPVRELLQGMSEVASVARRLGHEPPSEGATA